MARETVDYHDRIVRSPEILVGKPIVKGSHIPVELVLEKLAANPSIDELFREYPRLTMDDVRAVFAYAREKIAEAPGFVSPQEFYREATQREDVRRILDALAK
jgi:uncharacterized protein (DUF433 family)